MCKANKNNDFIQQFIFSVSPWRHFGKNHIHKQCMYADMLCMFRSKCKQCIHVHTLHVLFLCNTLHNSARVTQRRRVVEKLSHTCGNYGWLWGGGGAITVCFMSPAM